MGYAVNYTAITKGIVCILNLAIAVCIIDCGNVTQQVPAVVVGLKVLKIRAVHNADHSAIIVKINEFTGLVITLVIALGTVLTNQPSDVIVGVGGGRANEEISVVILTRIVGIGLGYPLSVCIIGEADVLR